MRFVAVSSVEVGLSDSLRVVAVGNNCCLVGTPVGPDDDEYVAFLLEVIRSVAWYEACFRFK